MPSKQWILDKERQVRELTAERDRLRAENDRLREALRPLANLQVHQQSLEPYSLVEERHGILTVGHVRAARAVLEDKP